MADGLLGQRGYRALSLRCAFYRKLNSIAVHWMSSCSNCCNGSPFDEMCVDTM